MDPWSVCQITVCCELKSARRLLVSGAVLSAVRAAASCGNPRSISLPVDLNRGNRRRGSGQAVDRAHERAAEKPGGFSLRHRAVANVSAVGLTVEGGIGFHSLRRSSRLNHSRWSPLRLPSLPLPLRPLPATLGAHLHPDQRARICVLPVLLQFPSPASWKAPASAHRIWGARYQAHQIALTCLPLRPVPVAGFF